MGYGVIVFIAILYGTGLSAIIRATLAATGSSDEGYYSVVTLHGLTMIFFYLMPLLYGVYGNYSMAHLASVSDMVLPRLNLFGLQTILYSLLQLLLCLCWCASFSYGWTMYPPISTQTSVEALVISLHISGMSSILTSLNLLLTTNGLHKTNRNPDLGAPLVIDSLNVGNTLVLLALPVLAGGITMLLLDSAMTTAFFTQTGAGDLLLYQHLFWFFGHPEVYILIMPCFGFESYMLAAGLGKPPINSVNMVLALYGIGFLSCCVWGHHLYTIGMPHEVRDYFSYSTLLIGVPTGVKFFSWMASLNKLAVTFGALEMSVFGFLNYFLYGGLSGILLANAGLDVVMHDTYYVVGHFHVVMAAAITYIVVGMYFLFAVDLAA